MDAIETYERDGIIGELFYDTDPGSPREWDNCAVLAQLSTREYAQIDGYDEADRLVAAWERWGDADMVERYARMFLGAVAVDWWDDPRSSSRVVGIVTREVAEREYLSDPLATFNGELQTYAEWCNGEVYFWSVGDESCGGYFGYEYALSEMRAEVDLQVADLHAKRQALYRSLVNYA